MSTFMFKCPACASELDVDDESRGETAECPNCQAEINIPLVKAPQVKVPHVKIPLEEAPPVQKKKLFVSQHTADALSVAGRLRQTSKAGLVAALCGGLVLGLLIGLCSPFRLSSILEGDFHVPPSFSVLRPSKGEWKSKLLQNYALQNNRIFLPAEQKNNPQVVEKYAVKNFLSTMGKPDKIGTVGGDTALAYVCSDGQVQVLISATNYAAGQLVGALINDE